MFPKMDDLFQLLDAQCEEFDLSQGHATSEVAACNNNDNFVTTEQGACARCMSRHCTVTISAPSFGQFIGKG